MTLSFSFYAKKIKTLTAKIQKILNKAQDQFQERNQNVQQGYIADLRQYCRIVTVSEEQLVINSEDFNFDFVGDLVKVNIILVCRRFLVFISFLYQINLIGFNNLNSFSQLILHLNIHRKLTTLQYQSKLIKHKNRFGNINESDAAQHMDELHDSIQSLAENNQRILDSSNTSVQNPIEVINSVTQQLKDNIRYNSRSISKMLLQKLFSNQISKNTHQDAYKYTENIASIISFLP